MHSVAMAMVVMGDMCVQSIVAIGCYVGNGSRLFVVLGEHIAMAMVVVELNFIVIHNTMY